MSEKGEERHIRFRHKGPGGYKYSIGLSGSHSSVYDQGIEAAQQWARLTPAYLRAALNFGDEFNFVVVGPPGVGKSTLINVLRGLSDSDADAAPLSGASAPLSEPKRYQWTEKVCLWEVPSFQASDRNAQSRYYRDSHLAAFDLIIILYSASVTPACDDLLAQADRWRQPVVFVRSQADLDFDELVQMGFDKSDAIRHVRKRNEGDFRLNVARDVPFFIISATAQPYFDLYRLRDYIAH